ncbi:SnoaL-like domain-containing protein [Microbacterium sp. ru370.1]|uniref:nuclear transport factor 2 family protein n=1 Tax=unclassified Microbacterium TaxID=2609290 RepID=UPI0008828BFF|nr:MULTISPECIES: nuclear transport factor 2 family protein [unclassified Microbacterium]SDO82894.1 SnoaL-like domain-containing protein [Microbacterium sp. ru370.1]SIT90055.1 SnoaL-like domain-containing protein [Microbacterium sp. RU1D]
MTDATPALSAPIACVERLLAALTVGDLGTAVSVFAGEARVVRVRYAEGRVAGGETLAVGRAEIERWLAEIIARDVSVRMTEYHLEGESLVVRTAWAMRGFDGERVQSSSLGVYDIVDGRIALLRATSREEEGAGRPVARV